ncbi:MAG: hypothetical protein IJW29_09880 [Clostridia bacterium]|nr:hypothetical protein [Clostridia bacterium]MBQ9785798.1 hypothetical protein [Clostridia bacterium]
MQKRRILRATALLFALLLVCAPLAACAKTHDPLTVTAFLSLTVNEKEKVTASVTLGLSDVQKHEGERAYLYELRPGESADAKTLSKKTPLDEAQIASSMKFKFELYDGIRSRLYSSFVVCYENKKPINAIPKMIDNPSVLAPDVTAPLWEDTPKGLSVTDTNTAAALGTAHALIDVDLAVLANHDKESDAQLFTYAGKRYYLSSLMLESLDEEIYAAYHAGMQVSLRIRTTQNDLSDDPARATLLRTAFLDFLAERYDQNDYGIVTAFFIDTDLSAEDTAHLAVLAHCALLSNISSGRIYVCCPDTTLAGAEEYCRAVGARLQGLADFDWGVALRLDPTVKTPWGTDGADTLTPDTLKQFRNTLSGQSNRPLYLALCDLAYSAKDPTHQAVAFAYTYARAVAANANLIFYGTQRDDTMGLESASGTSRPLTEMFRNIDTGLDSEQMHACRQISEEVAATVSALNVSRKVLTGTGNLSTGSGKKTVLYDFTSGERYDFSAVGGSDMPPRDNPMSYQSGAYNDPVLYTWLNTASPQTGVRKILSNGEELRDATSISMHVLAQYNQADIKSCIMILQLQGVDENGMPIRFEAQTNAPVRVWQDVNFNVSAFTSAADLSQPVVMTFLVTTDDTVENVDEDDFGLWIREISVHRPKNDYALFFTILATVVGVSVGFFLILWAYRRSRRAHR